MGRRVKSQGKKFCTECGSDLDEFWLSPGANNYEEVLKHHLECQRTGKFRGSMCSRLFIVDDGTPDTTKPKKKLSPRKLSDLKSSVLKNIEAEEGRRQKSPKAAK
jgi:hypothetical protein